MNTHAPQSSVEDPTTPIKTGQVPPPAPASPPKAWAGADKNRPQASGFWMAAALALVTTFWLYAQPGMVILLADQLWSCF